MKKYILGLVVLLAFGGLFMASTAVAQTVPPVVISEFSPVSGGEWVELSNTTSSPIDLNVDGYKLVDSANHVKPLLGVIPANGLLVFGYLEWLNNTGDVLTLLVGDANTPVMSVSYGDQNPGGQTLHTDSIPTSFESVVVNGNVLNIATPSRGWFNDISGGSPTWETIISQFCNPELGPCTASVIASNITSATNPSAISDLYFEKQGLGKILFSKPVNMTDQVIVSKLQSLGTAMDMSDRHIEFDSVTANAMDASGATLYIYGLPFPDGTTPSILVDGIPATDSDIGTVSYLYGTLTFTAKHFTQFDVELGVYVNADGLCGGMGPCYSTIQAGVDAVPVGGTVNVAPGTYNESVTIFKAMTLSGAGSDTTTISGSGMSVITINSDDVSIKGFTITNGSTSGMGIYSAEHSNLTITSNLLTNIGNSDDDVLGRGIVIVSSSSAINDINISNNQINYITSGMRTTSTSVSASGISIGWSAGTGDITGLVIDGNVISNINANTSPWNDPGTKGQGANGILINHTNGKGVNTGRTVAPQITNNTISNLEGLWVHGIGLEGNTPDAVLSNNIITGLTDHKTPSDAFAVFFEDNDGKTTVSIDGQTLGSTSSVMVDASWAGLGGNPVVSSESSSFIYGVNAFSTVQEAINAVAVDGKVNIASGTYNESLLINKSLALVGLGTTKPVVTGLAPTNYIVKIDSTANALLDNLEINGTGSTRGDNALDYGVWVNNSGTESLPVELRNLVVKNIWNTGGNGVEVDASSIGGSYAKLHDNIISGFDKRGVRFIKSDGVLYNNEIIGEAVDGVNRVQNLINLWGGSTVEIYGNKLHNALTTGTTPTWDSVGILVTAYDNNLSSQANIHNNEIYSGDSGVIIGSVYATTDTSSATITDNNFHNLKQAINFEKETISAVVHENQFTSVDMALNAEVSAGPLDNPPATDAEKNWWGTSTESEITALVHAGVDFSPYYVNAGMTTLSDGVATDATYTSTTEGEADMPEGATEIVLTDTTVLDLSNSTISIVSTDVTVGGNTVTLTQAVTLQSGVDGTPVVLTNSGLANVSASIPDGTKIQGPAGWNGTITPPVSGTPTGSTPAGFSVGSTVISVGSEDGTLVFDSPVTLLLSGVTGTVGYRPAGSTVWQTISNACGGDYTTPTAPAAPGECSISNGTDTKIVTFHFTTFGSLNTVSSGGGSTGGSTGGGGGGIVGLVGNFTYAPQLINTPVVVNAPAQTPTTGQVLGVAIFNFNMNLRLGTKNDDVRELQTRLTDEGVYTGPITGYFGALTLKAVRAYQEKTGLPQTGFFGPMTRTKLNDGEPSGSVLGVSTSSQAERNAMIESIRLQIQELIRQIAELQASGVTQ